MAISVSCSGPGRGTTLDGKTDVKRTCFKQHLRLAVRRDMFSMLLHEKIAHVSGISTLMPLMRWVCMTSTKKPNVDMLNSARAINQEPTF